MLADGTLTDPAFLTRLESLALLAKRVLAGSLHARRPTAQRGAGIVFSEHAEYHPGDDHRSIDWRVLARRDELVVRLFEREEEATLHLLLDVSASMRGKTLLTRQLAAAFGYLALSGLDRVQVFCFGDSLAHCCGPLHGRGRAPHLLRSLERAEEQPGMPAFAGIVRSLQARRCKRGLVIVLSDFLWNEGYAEGLRLLRASGHHVFACQVLGREDVHVDGRGDVELHCVESGLRRALTIDPGVAKRYQELLQSWNRDLARLCAKQGIGHLSCTQGDAFDGIIRGLIEGGGLV